MSGRFKGGVPSIGREKPEDAQAFISGAPGKMTLPWNEPHIRDDVKTDLNVGISERLKMKLDWLAYNTKTHKRVIAERAIQGYVDAELERLGIK